MRGIGREGAEENGGGVVGVHDGLGGLHAVRDNARHHAVEHVLEVVLQLQDPQLNSRTTGGRSAFGRILQADTREGPDAGWQFFFESSSLKVRNP